MNPTGFEDMTPAERILHVQDLWDRIAESPESVPITDAMKAELDRRLAALRAAPEELESWEVVKGQVRKRR